MIHQIAKIVGEGACHFSGLPPASAEVVRGIGAVGQGARTAAAGMGVATATLAVEAAGLVAIPLLFATLTRDELLANMARNRANQREAEFQLLYGHDVLEFSDQPIIEGASQLYGNIPALTPSELKVVQEWVLASASFSQLSNSAVDFERRIYRALDDDAEQLDPDDRETIDALRQWLMAHCGRSDFIKFVGIRTPEGKLLLWFAPYLSNMNSQFAANHVRMLLRALRHCPECRLVAAGSIRCNSAALPVPLEVLGNSGHFITGEDGIRCEFDDHKPFVDPEHAGMRTVRPLFQRLFPDAAITPFTPVRFN